MLQRLSINNYAIIDASEFTLAGGMSALTGETGAGKSILLDALGLVLGDRADSQAVREGAKRADISALFDIRHVAAASEWLEAHDLDEEPEQCLLRRVIGADGRSRAYINGQPSPLSQLKALGGLLIDIHGQHDHQRLTQRDHQRVLLDSYGQFDEATAEVATHYKAWHQAEQAHREALAQQKNASERSDLLNFQLQELNQFEFTAEEIQQLEEEHRKLANADQLQALGTQALATLYEEDLCAYRLLSRTQRDLSALVELDPEVQEWLELVDSAQIHCSEAATGLRDYLDHLDIDPERLHFVDQNIALLHRLSRKHQIDPQALPALKARLSQELDDIEHSDEHLEALRCVAQAHLDKYWKAAQHLSQLRIEAAGRLSAEISEAMQTLSMSGGVFEITCQWDEQQVSLHGADKVTFNVSTNPGTRPQPLSKVASGGELSRISLAISLITAQYKTLETLVFDEVDSGIGGGVAEMVGKKMRELSAHCQVLCVTHLPQVAAQAHHHLKVSKSSDQTHTTTQLQRLNKKQRVDEIARMLGGMTISAKTRSHARELLSQSDV